MTNKEASAKPSAKTPYQRLLVEYQEQTVKMSALEERISTLSSQVENMNNLLMQFLALAVKDTEEDSVQSNYPHCVKLSSVTDWLPRVSRDQLIDMLIPEVNSTCFADVLLHVFSDWLNPLMDLVEDMLDDPNDIEYVYKWILANWAFSLRSVLSLNKTMSQSYLAPSFLQEVYKAQRSYLTSILALIKSQQELTVTFSHMQTGSAIVAFCNLLCSKDSSNVMNSVLNFEIPEEMQNFITDDSMKKAHAILNKYTPSNGVVHSGMFFKLYCLFFLTAILHD